MASERAKLWRVRRNWRGKMILQVREEYRETVYLRSGPIYERHRWRWRDATTADVFEQRGRQVELVGIAP